MSTPGSESEKKVPSVNVMVVENSETRSINLVFDINRYMNRYEKTCENHSLSVAFHQQTKKPENRSSAA